MAGSSTDFNGAPFYLDPNQQDLLLAALASNHQDPNALYPATHTKQQNAALHANSQFAYPVDPAFDPTYFASPHQATPANAFGVDESPYVDYLDGDANFDFDSNDGVMIGALPGASPSNKGNEDTVEKRSHPEDGTPEPESRKRRDPPEEKQPKKPGRKPLTSEPTTKRKAQNRAAQRAFRERKEKHLKDLENKVSELEKASDAANHENGLLRAQVSRLQMELREYRKRLSLNSSGLSRPAPLAGGFSSLLGNGSTNFQFDFPKFGGLPTSTSKSTSINGPMRQDSIGRGLSPPNSASGSSVNSPATRSNSIPRTGLDGVITAPPSHNGSVSGQARVFQFNSGSSSHSNSPSASSNSQVGLNSSCETSPEPSHNSPPSNLVDSAPDGYKCTGNSEAAPVKPPTSEINGMDYFVNQNGGQFDPHLFGDYRDPQAAIMGDGDFTGGFFNDAFPLADFGSPFHFGDTPAVQKSNPLEEIERLQDGEGDDEVVPADDPSSMLNCHKIWDKLSNRPEFKEGTIDIDNLCSELRAKARCSESGVVVDTKDVEAALQRLPPKDSK